MNKKNILLFVIVLAFASISFAQSVRITPKKVSYQRTGASVPDHKKSFSINYPTLQGKIGKKIEEILNYEKSFDFKIQEEIKEIYWLESADFTVDYNKKDVLNVTLYIEGSGAYPSTSSKHFVINSKNGSRVKPTDVFIKLSGLAELGNKAQKAEMKAETARLKKDEPDFDPESYFIDAKFTTDNLGVFTVSDKGLTFHYDYGFPHVALALQPDGDFFFSWKQLKPFIKTTGLFGQFIK